MFTIGTRRRAGNAGRRRRQASTIPRIAQLIERVPPSRTLAVPRTRVLRDLATLPPDDRRTGRRDRAARRTVDAPGQFCLMLEDVQDPGNVGSMIRTAAAAGVDQVVLSPHCAFAWSPKALRAGQGAHFLTTLVEDVDLDAWIDAFRAAGGRLVATVVDRAPILYATDLRGRVAIGDRRRRRQDCRKRCWPWRTGA